MTAPARQISPAILFIVVACVTIVLVPQASGQRRRAQVATGCNIEKYTAANLTCATPFLRDYERNLAHRQQFDLSAPASDGMVLIDLFATDGTGTMTKFPCGASTNFYDIQKFAFLSKMHVSMMVARLPPCAANLPHIHPRAHKMVTIIKGRLNLTVAEENGGRVATVAMSAQNGMLNAYIIEQALPHSMHNLECEEAIFLASFNSEDPGSIALAQSIARFPAATVGATYNIPDKDVAAFQRRSAAVPFFAQGNEACMKRCKLM